MAGDAIKTPEIGRELDRVQTGYPVDSNKTYFNLNPREFFSRDYRSLLLEIIEDQYATRLKIPGIGTPLNIYKDTGNIRVYWDTPDDQKKVLFLLEIGALGSEIAEHPVMQKVQIENKKNLEAQEFIEGKNNSSPPDFPSSDTINTHGNKPRIVFQHSQVIVKFPMEGEGIYTFGATSCSIVTIIDKSTGQIGLAHFDGWNTEAQIRMFITDTGFSEPEIHILSGERDLMYLLVRAIPNKNSIKTMHADLKGDRNSAAGVFIQNGVPKIVYGLRQDWLPK